MGLVGTLCAQQKNPISVDLLGLYSAQNFISRLPHGDQTGHKARTNGSLFAISISYPDELVVLSTSTIQLRRPTFT